VPGEEPVTSPDLIGRDFTAPGPGQWLVGDITSLVTDALAMAITHGHVTPGAVFHSDRGTQDGFKGSSQQCR